MSAELGGDAGWSCLVVRPKRPGSAPAALAEQARWLGIAGVRSIRRSSLVFLRGDVDAPTRARLVDGILVDPLLQDASWSRSVAGERVAAVAPVTVVETLLHPGVTDPVAQAVLRGAALAGVTAIVEVATGTRYEIEGDLGADDVGLLVTRLLANPVVEHAVVGEISPPASHDEQAPEVEHLAVTALDDAALLALSKERGLALDLAEMHAVRTWFREQGREPTDVELETIVQMWSEHCAHKTFRAAVTWEDGTPVEPLLRQLRRATEAIAAPWVRSAFVDNAGIIAFDDDVELSIKAETHNHPSAIEPFGGANTGVGGVLRDVLGVSARPIAVTDVLCFGMPDADPADLPAGVLHPRRIRDGVIAGVADYGNKLGVPTVAGAIVHDPGYTANPLVFCGCVGVAPLGSHRTEPQVGDRVIVIGGHTGRDGIRGATFSSMEMDATTGEVAGASVQIGDPIIEKGVLDVLLVARDAGLYHAVTDCGAGGLSSAVGEMAGTLGADVSLAAVPRKYPGLAPWEAWLSEAQERMVFAVAPGDVAALQAVCDRYEVELADIGTFTGDKRLVVRDGGVAVLDLEVGFLHDGRPTRSLTARRAAVPAAGSLPSRDGVDPTSALLGLLAHPSLRSQQDVVHGYDHEVLGRTVVRPYGGARDDGPSDAAVFLPPGSTSGALAALGIGVNARFGAIDARAMAWSVIDEAIRNVVATGADPDRIALLDNFSWGDPRRPETMGQLVDAVTGCCEAALAHRAPFVSGKDSLNNEYATTTGARLAIPPTLVIHALGRIDGRDGVVTSDLKANGSVVFLVGATRAELAGSHLDLVMDCEGGGPVPAPDTTAPARYRLLHRAMTAGLVRSCHDLAEGGLAVAAAEMAMAGRLGLALDIEPVGGAGELDGRLQALFSESNGRLLVEVAPGDVEGFRSILGDGAAAIGWVVPDARLTVAVDGAPALDVALADLLVAWSGHLPEQAVVEGRRPETTTSSAPAAPAFVRRDVRAVVLAAPGTNRDGDVAEALALAGAAPTIVPLAALRQTPGLLGDAELVVVAGGFSFADALGSGALFALELADILTDAVGTLTASGRPVLGICNGFQVLVRLGLLPGSGRRAALDHNEAGRFECRWVELELPASRSIWTAGLDGPLAAPVAHGEGRFVAGDDTLAALRAGGQIALRYASSAYPDNPNGSFGDIAGICDETGLVLGLMPHPENHVHGWQHPRWTRGESAGNALGLFRNGVRQAAGA